MKRGVLQLALTFCCLSLSAPVRALDLMVGLNAFSFDYKETLPSPLKSTEKATVLAPIVQGRYLLPQTPGVMLGFEGELTGSVSSQFDGTTLTGVPVQDTNILRFLRGEATLYFPVALPISLYLGAGFKYWDRFLSGGSGYREIYSWAYAPVGILLEVPVASNLQMGLDISHRSMFNGTIKIIFSETVSGGKDTDLTLGNKAGYKIQLPVTWRIPSSALALKLSPWYEFSEIGESDIKFNGTPSLNSNIQEPASRTIQYGLATGLQFSF